MCSPWCHEIRALFRYNIICLEQNQTITLLYIYALYACVGVCVCALVLTHLYGITDLSCYYINDRIPVHIIGCQLQYIKDWLQNRGRISWQIHK